MGSARRPPNAFLGILKCAGLLLALPWRLLWWYVHAVHARGCLRRELVASGVPEEAAEHLAHRYKLNLLQIARQFSAVQ